jgi:hypothetical protein
MKRDLSQGPRINVLVPESIRKELEAEAQYKLMSISDVVRTALRDRYEQRSKEG